MDRLNKEIIRVKNLSVSYIDRKPHLTVLKSANLLVNKHEFVSIIGPSGCGKSTLFGLIADILNKEIIKVDGEIKVLRDEPFKARTSRRIGVVFQKPTLLDWRTVEKNISLPLEIIGKDKVTIKDKVSKLLKLVNLEKYAKFSPNQLSGGMQQKVSIARALAYNPDILLMDEPFGALDEINREYMNHELIKVWKETKKTILFITHNITEAVYLSQKIVVFSHLPGRVKGVINIDLPYPRDSAEEKKDFYQYVIKVRKLLKNE